MAAPIFEQRGCVFFIALDLVVVVELGLSKSSGRNDFCMLLIHNGPGYRCHSPAVNPKSLQ